MRGREANCHTGGTGKLQHSGEGPMLHRLKRELPFSSRKEYVKRLFPLSGTGPEVAASSRSRDGSSIEPGLYIVQTSSTAREQDEQKNIGTKKTLLKLISPTDRA